LRKIILAGALLAATSPAAWAKCTTTVSGNLNIFQCESDNQAADGDELKMFIDKATGVTNVEGSLGKNTSDPAFQNIKVTSDAAFNQEGNGFAELHSADAGSPTNALHTVTFAPILPSTLDTNPPRPFPGFDGWFGRGQVDPLGGTGKKLTWDGDVFLDIVFQGGGTQTLTFTGDTAKDDIGAFGFDEINEPGKLVQSVTMRLDATGAWNEVKQFEFSVPGVTAIPEPSTWGLALLGFGFVSLMGWRRGRVARLA
jgi:hypothetical protein